MQEVWCDVVNGRRSLKDLLCVPESQSLSARDAAEPRRKQFVFAKRYQLSSVSDFVPPQFDDVGLGVKHRVSSRLRYEHADTSRVGEFVLGF